MKRSSERSCGLEKLKHWMSSGSLCPSFPSPARCRDSVDICEKVGAGSKGLCCFSICMSGNMLVDTKEKLMQIQGRANANSGIGRHLPSQEPTCPSPAPISQHMHNHGTSPAMTLWDKEPVQALWHTCLHPWQTVSEFEPPESITRFLPGIFLRALGCRQLICEA